jgi:DNA-binding NarL/FixJ family response regulator
MNILIVDNHILVRDGLCSLLEAAGHKIVGQAGDGEVAIYETARLRPDLVLMDINMPKMDGIKSLREIKKTMPDTKVVMLTISENEGDLVDAIKAKANGYLLKSQSGEDFLNCLANLENGELALHPSTVTRLIHTLMDQNRRCENQNAELTAREIDVLYLIAQGYSNKIIGKQLSVSENTVKYYVKKILQKLEVHNRTEAASFALRTGILEEESVNIPEPI